MKKKLSLWIAAGAISILNHGWAEQSSLALPPASSSEKKELDPNTLPAEKRPQETQAKLIADQLQSVQQQEQERQRWMEFQGSLKKLQSEVARSNQITELTQLDDQRILLASQVDQSKQEGYLNTIDEEAFDSLFYELQKLGHDILNRVEYLKQAETGWGVAPSASEPSATLIGLSPDGTLQYAPLPSPAAAALSPEEQAFLNTLRLARQIAANSSSQPVVLAAYDSILKAWEALKNPPTASTLEAYQDAQGFFENKIMVLELQAQEALLQEQALQP